MDELQTIIKSLIEVEIALANWSWQQEMSTIEPEEEIYREIIVRSPGQGGL